MSTIHAGDYARDGVVAPARVVLVAKPGWSIVVGLESTIDKGERCFSVRPQKTHADPDGVALHPAMLGDEVVKVHVAWMHDWKEKCPGHSGVSDLLSLSRMLLSDYSFKERQI